MNLFEYVAAMQYCDKIKFIEDYEAWAYGNERFSDFAHNEVKKFVDSADTQISFYDTVDAFAMECYRWFYHNPTASH